MDNSPPYVSIVIPVYCAMDSLGELVQRLDKVMAQKAWRAEAILVDDASLDQSWDVMLSLKSRYPDLLKVMRLHDNGGQHSAILTGFDLATGDIVLTMDDDLQHPPEEVPKLVGAIERGSDLVIGAYSSKRLSGMRNLSGGLVDWLIRRMFGLPRGFQLTSFRAARRHVIQGAMASASARPYVTTLLLSHAMCSTHVVVRHDLRKYGASNYTLLSSLRLTLHLLASYPTLLVKRVFWPVLATLAVLWLLAAGFAYAF